MIRPTTPRSLPISLFLAGLAAACSGSSGGSAGAIGFQLTRISLPNGAVWQINREIEFTFNEPIDFSTVNLNTINIQSQNGAPATGTFSFRQVDTDGDGIAETVDDKTVIFQPHCPTEPDLSDAGLIPGGITYNLVVVGQSSGTFNTVRSKSAQALNTTQSRTFTTPASTNPSSVFLDTTLGPPMPVVRAAGAVQVVEGVTYVEIGMNPDPASRIFFEFDASTQTYSAVPGPSAPAAAPLNLYSSESTSVAVVIEFDQSVDPSSTNISPNRLSLEFLDGAVWVPIDTQVELIANCTPTGARVRLVPIGLLPPGSQFRAVVQPGFQDIVGQPNLLANDKFAVAPTQVLNYASLMNPTDGADEFLEQFSFGGEDELSFQDTNAVFATPEAEWGNGTLTAAFTFSGTGGPGGNFDWVVHAGESFFFDTTATQIIGGPGGIPTTIQNSTGGVVDVRNLTIEVGGEIRVQGPNPFLLNATGDVRIEGILDLSGFQAKDVSTLNTGNQVEQGGSGTAGSGRGGHASEITNNSTPRGGFGQGPFGEANTGGQGGESGFAMANLGKDARRPGGGGGGRFAADMPPLIAENGYPGSATATGAVTNQAPALGGLAGVGPFFDGDPTNNFFGVKPIVTGGVLTGLIRGELTQIWAGYGGGGGGDALPSPKFPTPRWSPGSDEKGGGGGGGGGNCRIRALGRIIFGATGTIQVKGARGATGENTFFLDHIGGSGGSGSGGHAILESATEIDFTDGGLNVSATPRDWVDASGAATVVGSKSGGSGGTPVPCGISHGGAGGPGVIQLHVPDPISPPSNNPAVTDIVVPTSALSSSTPLNEVAAPEALAMIPTFGAQSVARSKWISIGGADRMPGGGADLVQFLFEGVQTAGPDEGKILAASGIVNELPPLLGPETVGGTNPNVAIEADEVTLRISGSSLDPLINDPSPISDDIYLRTPVLLRNFILRLWLMQATSNFQDFNVVDATYDDVAQILLVTVSGSAGSLQDFVTAAGGATIEYQLIPRFFRVITNNVENSLPTTAFVQVRFEATGDDGTGNPDEQNILVPLTGDISEFNNLNPGELKFFRFQVDFNLDAQSLGVSAQTKPITLDFLRIPFRF